MRNVVKVFLAAAVFALAIGPLAAAGRQQGTGSASQTTPITWWLSLSTNVSANYSNLGESPFGKGLMERTNTQITFLHPVSGSETEQFNLIIADTNKPDLMESNWLGYPGGPEKAIADGVIISLNDVFAKYCPNLTAFLKANPEYDKMIRTDNGTYYVFPMIRNDPKLLNATGAMIRKDWLDELSLQIPTTIDEWHTVLTAFKQRKGGAPLTFESSFLNSHENAFSYAYNVIKNLYVGTDGKIHLGLVENGYRDFVTLMAQWYKEGLLDPDIATLNLAQVSAKMTSGTSGASIGYMGSRMGSWIPGGRATNPNFTLAATPYPALRKGDAVNFSPSSIPYNAAGGCVAITTSCKNIEAAARLLDWAYSPAGQMYYNFGIEGESYTMINGYPTYTDFVMKNPQGWPVVQAMSAYTRATYNGPFVQDGRYIEQYQALPEQKNALTTWAAPGTLSRLVPPLTPTPEESREYATIMNDINTYANEMILKFILGTENLSSWNTYVTTINRMNLARALEIQNNALARYNKR